MDCAARLFHLFEGAGHPFAVCGVKRRCWAAPHGAGGGGNFCVTTLRWRRGCVRPGGTPRWSGREGCHCRRGGGGPAAGGPHQQGGGRPARGGRGPAAGRPRRRLTGVLAGQDEVSRHPEDEIQRPCRRGGGGTAAGGRRRQGRGRPARRGSGRAAGRPCRRVTGLGERWGGRDRRRMLARGDEATAEVRGGGGCRGGGRAAEGLVNGIKIKSSGTRRISLN